MTSAKNWAKEIYRKHSGALTVCDDKGRAWLKMNPDYEGPLEKKPQGCTWCGSGAPDDTFGNCLACGGIRIVASG